MDAITKRLNRIGAHMAPEAQDCPDCNGKGCDECFDTGRIEYAYDGDADEDIKWLYNLAKDQQGEIQGLKIDLAFRAKVERTEAEGIRATLLRVLESELWDGNRCVTDTGRDMVTQHNAYVRSLAKRLGIELDATQEECDNCGYTPDRCNCM